MRDEFKSSEPTENGESGVQNQEFYYYNKNLEGGKGWYNKLMSGFNRLKRKWRAYRTRGNTRGFWASQLGRAKLWRNLALAGLVMVVAGTLMTAALFAWYARDLPQPDKIVRREGFSTKILDREGELLYEVFADQQRTNVTLEQVPTYLEQATLAIEDKNFYSHTGFDLKGWLRSLWTIITQRRLVGGSTLTQQLVKNVLLTQEKTLPRKIKEFILAVQIESKYSKDEILQMYLNEAPYGGTAWGVSTAAQTYFGKDVSELDLIESAILAGMPQLPSVYTPFGKNPTAYIGRTENVLRRMREDGHITPEQEASAAASLSSVQFSGGYTSIKAPHFVLYVKDILEEMYGESLVEKGGLSVTTTLDYELHQEAQTIVTEEIDKAENLGIGNGAAMVINPVTGEILSMVGSKDFFADDYDGQVNVTLSERQPGSAIKPVTYLTGFMKGYTPATMLMDVPTEFPSGDGEPYTPQNYDGQYRGPVQLRFALGSSLNVPAVKLLALVGVKDMLQVAYDMGLKTLEPTPENLARFGLAVTLGGGEVRLLDLATAYSAFANSGKVVEPVSILKVEDQEGKLLYEHKQVEGRRVMKESEAFLVNHVLMDNNARLLTFGPNSYLNLGNRNVSVKTGTTNDRRDNWTIGWGSSVLVGVWVGNNDNSPMKNVASGVSGASPIWRRIILKAIDKYPIKNWPVPGDVEARKVDVVSGYPEHDGFASRTEYVIKGTLPTTPDPIHAKLKLCRGQNKLATPVDIQRNEFEEKEYYVFTEDTVIGTAPSWQKGIDAWLAGQGDEKYKPPTELCDTQNEIIVGFDDPKNENTYQETSIPVRIRVVTSGEMDKVEIFVNGSLRETLTARPYETTLDLPRNTYTLRARAIRKDGKSAETGDFRIGTGGMDWNGNSPTPTAAATPTQIITPSPSITP